MLAISSLKYQAWKLFDSSPLSPFNSTPLFKLRKDKQFEVIL